MGRPVGAKNKNTELYDASDKPIEMEPITVEEARAEKATENKSPTDFKKDLKLPEIKCLTDLKGIGPKTADRLREQGYDVEELATSRPDEIASIMGVSYAIAKGWTMEAQNAILAKITFKTASEQDIDKKLRQFHFKTGSPAFNNILGGGISTWAITGLSGRLASGKTEICHEVALDAIYNYYTCPTHYIKLEKGVKCPKCSVEASKVKAVYIETEPDTFHLDRMKQMATAKGYRDVNWDNLYVAGAEQVPTMKAQFLQYKVVQRLLEQGENIKLVIIDSFNAKIRAGWGISQMLPIRSRELAEHFNLMEFLAAKYNVAWLITCQVIGVPRPEMGLALQMKVADNYIAVGGDILLHSVNQWVALTQVKTEIWKATIFDSSYLPRTSAEFMISNKGIVDGIR